MSEHEIHIPLELTPRFKLENQLDDGTNVFSADVQPHVGFLSADPGTLFLVGFAFDLFNPVSLPALESAKVGDLIQVTCDPNHEIFKFWEPTEEYQIPEGFTRMFKVIGTSLDAMKFPVVVATDAL